MYSLVPLFSLICFHLMKTSLECESNATLWTYYPCSFIISPTSFYCQHVLINSLIDQCTSREMVFFWHFPFGNMTLTLQSDQNRPFLLRLSQTSLSTNKLIRNVYHLLNNKTFEERLIYDNENATMTLYSDRYNSCSIKFESTNSNVVDYGTFFRMTILIDENKNLF